MTSETGPKANPPGADGAGEDFAELARRGQGRKGGSALLQLLLYVQESRRWWLLPVILALLLIGFLVILGTTGAAPFIYTLF